MSEGSKGGADAPEGSAETSETSGAPGAAVEWAVHQVETTLGACPRTSWLLKADPHISAHSKAFLCRAQLRCLGPSRRLGRHVVLLALPVQRPQPPSHAPPLSSGHLPSPIKIKPPLKIQAPALRVCILPLEAKNQIPISQNPDPDPYASKVNWSHHVSLSLHCRRNPDPDPDTIKGGLEPPRRPVAARRLESEPQAPDADPDPDTEKRWTGATTSLCRRSLP